MNSKVNGLIEKDGFVQVGAKQIPVDNFHQAYEVLMKEGFQVLRFSVTKV